ncbi:MULTISPECIES: phage integrase N-terminal SAM-like domain-containing protein [unclassified Sphingopyxis]|uniref:phage integrase N-terminal SAM-like domain-containing protein n=1 Tax=unclassified Sphingopyxis TaxID=2614943 RepID=UPI001F6237EA|nr:MULTISPECIES: phage integrase N-terminal SAM-like domain-containing protein [unclassified Sphingopyxis]USI76566.1 phage integrase N-terminal SAM-like domain-containing protein [Sphingopyxis sp. USTB-05]
MDELIQIDAISPLSQCLIDNMTLRGFSPETQRNYLLDVGRFATWLRRSPHTASTEDIRQFQFEQHQSGVWAPTMNSIVGAPRFFFMHTLDRSDLARSSAHDPCGSGIEDFPTPAASETLNDSLQTAYGQLRPNSSRTAVRLFGSNINRIPIDEKEPNSL